MRALSRFNSIVNNNIASLLGATHICQKRFFSKQNKTTEALVRDGKFKAFFQDEKNPTKLISFLNAVKGNSEENKKA